MERGEGWGIWFAVITLIGRGGGGVDMPISVNTGGRDEVMLTQTLETGGGGGGSG